MTYPGFVPAGFQLPRWDYFGNATPDQFCVSFNAATTLLAHVTLVILTLTTRSPFHRFFCDRLGNICV